MWQEGEIKRKRGREGKCKKRVSERKGKRRSSV
jgi:hypothetical protein